MNWIIPFTFSQTPRGICYDSLFPLLDLIQNCTKSISTSVSVENERGLKVCIGKDWGLCAEPLQSLKGLLLFRAPMHPKLFPLTGCPPKFCNNLLRGLATLEKFGINLLY